MLPKKHFSFRGKPRGIKPSMRAVQSTFAVGRQNLCARFFLIAYLWLSPVLCFGQHLKNVPEAFEALSTEAEVILISNDIEVPNERGHLQGVQLIEKNGTEKLLISGSSLDKAYILQVDLATRTTDKLITLMKAPYRHAGGIQVSGPYVIVGIEDNFIRTSSKVRLYNYLDTKLYTAQPNFTFDRKGEAERHTAGATGLLVLDTTYLIVVSNWGSRDWDFYHLNPENGEHIMLERFTAPDDWAGYQSINLIKDGEAIYAIGFYKKEGVSYADLILVSKLGTFVPIMKKMLTKAFKVKEGVDFGTAAGLQVDKKGNLHIWGTQKNALKQIAINRFSQE